MKKQLVISVLAGSFCGLLFGYDIGAISSATPELRPHFALSATALGIAISAALFGTIAGSICTGFIGDAIERRRTLVISGLLYIVGSLGAAFAPGFAQFAAFRFLCGIAIGLISVATPMYIAEIAPSLLRGRLVGTFQLNISIGVVLGFLGGYVFSLHLEPEAAWRWSLACGVIPALLCEVLLLRASPSPRWLVLNRRFAEASIALADLGSIDPAADQNSFTHSVDEFGTVGRPKLFCRRHARPILLAASIAIFNQFTGVNVLLYYILDVFRELGSGRLNGRKDAILMSAFSLLVTTVAVSVIDKVGRRPLLLAGAAGMGACLFVLPAIRYLGWPASAVIIVLLCYNLFFGFSQGAVVWVYLSELFLLPVRARGQSFGSTVHWVANAFIVASFPAIVSKVGGKVFVALAAVMLLQFFVIFFAYPETKQTSLESLASAISG
jgi:sugar porter (SP) family MFS transporter